MPPRKDRKLTRNVRNNPLVNHKVGSYLRDIRKLKKKTHKVMAEHLGMTTPNYANIEKGKTQLSFPDAIKIARFLNVPLDMLYREGK